MHPRGFETLPRRELDQANVIPDPAVSPELLERTKLAHVRIVFLATAPPITRINVDP
jgi:hypothetical protein